jgi:hypothetical protein
MKLPLLLIVILLASCTKETTLTRTSAEIVTLPGSGYTGCEQMREKLEGTLKARVPELEEIGAPYVRRITNGYKGVEYFGEHCADPAAADSLNRDYYAVSVGYTVELSAKYWYGFYINRDLHTILVYDFTTGKTQPLEAIRASDNWKQEWLGRK